MGVSNLYFKVFFVQTSTDKDLEVLGLSMMGVLKMLEAFSSPGVLSKLDSKQGSID